MKVLIFVLSVVLISGCAPVSGGSSIDENIKTQYLSDGTKCAVISVHNGVGVSCDWDGESK